MRHYLLHALFFCLCAQFPVLANPSSEAEMLVLQVTKDLNSGRISQAVEEFHVDAVAKQSALIFHIARTSKSPSDLAGFLSLYGVSSVEELEALPEREVVRLALVQEEAQKAPMMKQIMASADYKIVGSIVKGDQAFVVVSCEFKIPNAAKKTVVSVVVTKKEGEIWRYLGNEI